MDPLTPLLLQQPPGAKDAPPAGDEGAVLEFKQYTRRDRSFY